MSAFFLDGPEIFTCSFFLPEKKNGVGKVEIFTCSASSADGLEVVLTDAIFQGFCYCLSSSRLLSGY